MFYFFDSLPSTIDEARDEKYRPGDVVVAEFQTAGRGQRGNRWASEAGTNLMFSVVLDASYLLAGEQFMLLQAVALALTDTMASWGLDARIKWTNDIYIGDRKITGVLIDHAVSGAFLGRSGAGIGINVNQTVFDDWLPNPTSMALELGREVDRGAVLERFYECLTGRLNMLREVRETDENGVKIASRADLLSDYHEKIYRLGVPARYRLASPAGRSSRGNACSPPQPGASDCEFLRNSIADGTGFIGIIRGVAPTGELAVEMPDRTVQQFLFKEIEFVI